MTIDTLYFIIALLFAIGFGIFVGRTSYHKDIEAVKKRCDILTERAKKAYKLEAERKIKELEYINKDKIANLVAYYSASCSTCPYHPDSHDLTNTLVKNTPSLMKPINHQQN